MATSLLLLQQQSVKTKICFSFFKLENEARRISPAAAAARAHHIHRVAVDHIFECTREEEEEMSGALQGKKKNMDMNVIKVGGGGIYLLKKKEEE